MTPNDIATKQDINMLHEKINLLIEELAKIKSAPENSQQEIYLTSKEVMETYKMSKGHLTDLRTEGKIRYSNPFGILLYPKSEIEKILRTIANNPMAMNFAAFGGSGDFLRNLR